MGYTLIKTAVNFEIPGDILGANPIGCAMGPMGKFAYVAFDDGRILRWDTHDMGEPRTYKMDEAENTVKGARDFRGCTLTSDCEQALFSLANGRIELYNLDKDFTSRTIKINFKKFSDIRGCAFSSNLVKAPTEMQILVATSSNGNENGLWLINTHSEKEIKYTDLTHHAIPELSAARQKRQFFLGCATSADGQKLLVALNGKTSPDNGSVYVLEKNQGHAWNIRSLYIPDSISKEGQIKACALSGDGSIAVCVYADGSDIYAWNLNQGGASLPFQSKENLPHNIQACALSRDGKRIFAVSKPTSTNKRFDFMLWQL